MMNKTCTVCGLVYIPKRNRKILKYCSSRCRNKDRYVNGDRQKKIPIICQGCGKKGFAFAHSQKRFCSKSCAALNRKGENSPSWKGGVIINPSGYISIKQKNGKYKLEQRIVMEGIIGRELNPYEQVHHINGITTDNRPENLAIKTHSGHHGFIDCPYCHKTFSPTLKHGTTKILNHP